MFSFSYETLFSLKKSSIAFFTSSTPITVWPCFTNLEIMKLTNFWNLNNHLWNIIHYSFDEMLLFPCECFWIFLGNIFAFWEQCVPRSVNRDQHWEETCFHNNASFLVYPSKIYKPKPRIMALKIHFRFYAKIE